MEAEEEATKKANEDLVRRLLTLRATYGEDVKVMIGVSRIGISILQTVSKSYSEGDYSDDGGGAVVKVGPDQRVSAMIDRPHYLG